MRVGHYYRQAVIDDSGVTQSMGMWSEALLCRGHEVVVFHEPTDIPRMTYAPGVDLRDVRHIGGGRASAAPIRLEEHLDVDVLFIHEGWVTANLVAARAAAKANKPYVMVPHGVYEPQIVCTLRQPRALRTRMEARMLNAAAASQLFFESEAGLVRAIAPGAKTFVAPTGFNIGRPEWTGGGGYLAWFGRYDVRHKGLDHLLAAVAADRDLPRLKMHGYDYRGGKQEVIRLVEEMELQDRVEVGGLVKGTAKRDFLAAAELYVHPSRWESHSVALVETLAFGVPTVVSSSIHIATELLRAGAAAVAAPGTELANGIRDALARPELGAKGHRFVATELSWDAALKKLEAGLRANGVV